MKQAYTNFIENFNNNLLNNYMEEKIKKQVFVHKKLNCKLTFYYNSLTEAKERFGRTGLNINDWKTL